MLHIEMTLPPDERVIEAAVEALVAVNVLIMEGRRVPELYTSGVIYREEPDGSDVWKTYDQVLADGEGDCEDVSAARAAELRCQGDLMARVVVRRVNESQFHALVQRGDGGVEDVSRILITREVTAMNARPTIALTESGRHCIGSISVPLAGGRTIEVHELGFDAWSALTSALDEVWKVVSNPVVSAVLPPQAAIAIQIAKAISDMPPDGLKSLINNPKATDAQKSLARQMLKAKTGTDDASTPATQAQHATEVLNDWSIWQKGNKQATGAAARTPGPIWQPATVVHMDVRDHRGGQGGASVADPNRQTATYQPTTGPVRNLPPTLAPGGGAAPPAGTPDTAATAMDPGGMTSFPPGSLPPVGIPGMTPPGVMPGVPGMPGGMPGMPGLQVVSLYNPNGVSVPGFVWVDNGDGVPPHWERPHVGWPQLTPQNPVIYPQLPNYGVAPTYPSGYPGFPGLPVGYPGTPGYPGMPGYPMPGMQPGYPMQGYPAYPGYPMGYPMPGYEAYSWFGLQPVTPDAQPLTSDEQQALQVWGSNAFAEGSFPGYV